MSVADFGWWESEIIAPVGMETPTYGSEDLNRIIKDKLPLTQVQKKDDKSKFSEIQKFRQEVQVIVHTANNSEKWAVIDFFKPPELQLNTPLIERPVDLYEQNWIVLGMFGGYKSALIQTEQGNESREELEDAIGDFPSARIIIAIGVAYANNPDKSKYGDVLVSSYIDGVSNVKYSRDGLIIFRASSSRFMAVPRLLRNVFARGEQTWYAEGGFKCSKEGRESRVLSGVIISDKALIDNKEVRESIRKNAPEAIGGEMEGVVLGEIRQWFARGKYSPPRELGVIVIKGVADYGDGTKGKEWQLTAATAAASYAEHKLKLTDGKLFSTKGK